MDFDQMLIKCGDFNRYQFMLLLLFGFINIITGIHYFSQTVISFLPDHWCYHERIATKTYEEIAAIYSNFSEPSCTRLNETGDDDAWTASAERCERWIYNYDYGYKSMNTELNWVCQKAYKARVGQSLFFIGSLVGSLAFGMLSDRIGRLPSLIACNMCACFGDFATIFAKDVLDFSACRFLSGLAADSNYYLMQIIVLEYVTPSKRSFSINICSATFYSLALVGTPWIAVLAGDWKRYLVYTSLPVLLVIFFYFAMQESAQWLITRDNIDGAIRRLKRVAKFNGRDVPESDFQKFREHCKEKSEERQRTKGKQTAKLSDMLKTPRMRKITLILFFKSIVITLCYDAVARNVEGMGISPIMMLSLNGLMVIPSSVLAILLQDRIGRKAMASGSMFLAGIFTITSGLIIAYQKSGQRNLALVCLSLAARFGVGISYNSGSLYAVELIPTSVRGRGVAAVHVVGFAASFLSPYVLLLGNFMKAAPPIMLGALFFMGSYVCLLLPETLNKNLPKTVEEGELFGVGERMFDFPCLQGNRERADSDVEMETKQQIESLLEADKAVTINAQI